MPRVFFLYLVLTAVSACSSIPFLHKGSDTGNGNGSGQPEEPLIDVQVAGVDQPVADNIRAHVGLSRSRCTVPVELLQRRSDKTRTETVLALQALGYYEADVAIEIHATKDCPVAIIKVEPGRRMPVRKVSLLIEGEAEHDPEFRRLLEDLPLREGTGLSHGDYSDAKSRIESAAAELGYLDGRFVATQLIIDIENYAADARLHYLSGDRYRLGEVRLMQEPMILREDLVERLMEAPEGEPYHVDQVVGIQDRLGSSGYFGRVEARPRLSTPEAGSIPVDVTVTPSERHHFSASLGFATDVGFRSRLGYTNRWWNDRGHRLGAELRLSQVEQGLSGNYQIPREHPADEWLQFSAGLRQEDVDTFETQAVNISLLESKRRPWNIMENRFLHLTREDFEVGNERGLGTFLIPGLRWARRVVDNELYPNRGLNLSFEVRGGSDAIVSDTSFLRTSFHGHYLRALGLGVRSSVRTDLGAMWVDRFRALPPSERFFAGGDNSIRGYDFQDLGPVNTNGQVIGGRYLAIVSLELEKQVIENWGIAAFVDTGNAYGGPGEDTGLKTGAGLGLRWRSPVGPVRIDLAHPLDDDDTLVRFHMRIGPEL